MATTEKATAADYWGPEGFDDGPAWPYNIFDGGTVESSGVTAMEAGGYASPYTLAFNFDNTDGELYAIANPGTAQSELWLRFYVDTNVLTGMAASELLQVFSLYNAAYTAALIVYLLYDAGGALSQIYATDSGGNAAATTVVPAGTGMLCVEVHYKSHLTEGAVEGWIDNVAFASNSTGVDTITATGSIGENILCGSVTNLTTEPAADRWVHLDHFAISTLGRVGLYEHNDTKQIALANIAAGFNPVAAAHLGGILAA